MKKVIILWALALTTTLPSQSQSIDNSSFENWEQASYGAEPSVWKTFNTSLVNDGCYAATTKSEGGHQGNYSIKLTNIDCFGIVANNIQYNQAYTGNLCKLKGWYKYASGIGNDRAEISISYISSETGKAIYTGKVVLNVEKEWTSFTIDAKPIATGASSFDHLQIVCKASADESKPTLGATLYLDDFSLEVISGMAEIETPKNLECYPNPTNEEVYINDADFCGEKGIITMTDLQGKTIPITPNYMHNGSISIPLKNVEPGIYYIHYQNEKLSKVGRIIKL
jgi:hypothetical protein